MSLNEWNVKVCPLCLIIWYLFLFLDKYPVFCAACRPAESMRPLFIASGKFVIQSPNLSNKNHILPFTAGSLNPRLAERKESGLDRGSVWGLDAACGLPIDDRCPVIWMLLTYCHCFHSAAFSYSNFHFFVVSESSCEKANRFLPRENLLKILLHFPYESELRWSSWQHLYWYQCQHASSAGSWPLGQQCLLS